MSEQDGRQASILPRPTTNDPDAWQAYWKAQGQPWRTEPETDTKHQKQLAQHRSIVPNIQQGIYPFKGIKLSRADIEWLLATHENDRGPVDWSDESQRGREGLDLRAADLRHVDLHYLPLARLRGGLTLEERKMSNEEQWFAAGVLMEGVNLRGAHLQGATLSEARLQGAILRHAHLQGATLVGAQLQQAVLSHANLQGTDLRHAWLEGVNLADAVHSDEKHIGPLLAYTHWGNADLAVVDWSSVSILGDEYIAHQKKRDGKVKEKATRLNEYRVAVRAYRQLEAVLQEQKLDEEAVRFAIREQVLQRQIFWIQRLFGIWLFSWLVALLTGYGYRLGRIFVAYVLVVLLCAVAYFVLGMSYEPHLSFLDAVLTSVTAFHGRVFSQPFLHPGEPQLWVTAFEAVAGLVIEGVFIAMLTQRFFGR